MKMLGYEKPEHVLLVYGFLAISFFSFYRICTMEILPIERTSVVEVSNTASLENRLE